MFMLEFLKLLLKQIGEIEDVKIVNLFSFTLKDIVSDQCNNNMGYLDYTFAKLQLAFYKWFKTIQNDEQVYLQLKNMK